MSDIIFDGKKSSGVVNFDRLAKTRDYEKFICRAVVAVRISKDIIMNKENFEKELKKEMYKELKKLVDEFGEDLK